MCIRATTWLTSYQRKAKFSGSRESKYIQRLDTTHCRVNNEAPTASNLSAPNCIHQPLLSRSIVPSLSRRYLFVLRANFVCCALHRNVTWQDQHLLLQKEYSFEKDDNFFPISF